MRSYFTERHPLTAADRIWRTPWLVLAATAALAALGTMTLYSVAGGSYDPWAERHALRYLGVTAAVLVMVLVPPRIWLAAAYPFYAVALLLLLLVPFAGVEALGARRWLDVAGLSFQPAELMKVALVPALARYYQGLPAGRLSRPQWVAPPLAMILVPVVLVLRQPDLGSAMLFAVLGLTLMFLAGVSAGYFAAGAIAVASALPFLVENLHDYQRRRLEIFLDPDSDPLGAGYHILQSKIALGAGGFAGKGFMQGTQSQLDFLPEKHTDFIFTMIGEEWGFLGGMMLIAVYALLIGLMIRMAIQARTPFARLLIAGSAMTIFLYVFINVAMVTGLVPVVGVPLPLVSYGGTSMVTLMTGVGLALSAHVHGREPVRRGPRGTFP
ncbi:MAG: rod shape-determining protein RodA [Hyphomicrobium sp.]